MKTSLQLNLGQQLTLTPQLQQAIRLLQLSTLALQQEIQQTLEANPMLEMEENRETPAAANDATLSDKLTHTDTALQNESIPKELPVDTAWDDIYPTNFSKQNYNKDAQVNLENTISCHAGLQEYLTWQMQLTPFSTIDRLIATAIIDAIDDNGFLSCSLEDIQISLASDAEEPIELDEITAVLHRIQHFDPISVGARDLSECLLIQLQQLPANTPIVNEAKLIVSKYMQLLGQRNYKQLLRQTKLSQAQLETALQLIKSLNPRPGAALAANNAEYIAPDVRVTKHNNRWVVELNTEAIPKLRINNSYAGLIQRANQSNDNNFLRNNLQEARWFIKSLQSRNETLLKVATCIVEQQKGFLEYGEEAMKPLILHDIAQALDMHESTISRVTTQKYMHTPRGIFELKYFFSSHVSTNSGGECSATAIRALIKKLVAAENPHKPLSDNKIAQLLKEQGINIARRTIAKYREAMSIPPSNERKSLFSDQ